MVRRPQSAKNKSSSSRDEKCIDDQTNRDKITKTGTKMEVKPVQPRETSYTRLLSTSKRIDLESPKEIATWHVQDLATQIVTQNDGNHEEHATAAVEIKAMPTEPGGMEFTRPNTTDKGTLLEASKENDKAGVENEDMKNSTRYNATQREDVTVSRDKESNYENKHEATNYDTGEPVNEATSYYKDSLNNNYMDGSAVHGRTTMVEKATRSVKKHILDMFGKVGKSDTITKWAQQLTTSMKYSTHREPKGELQEFALSPQRDPKAMGNPRPNDVPPSAYVAQDLRKKVRSLLQLCKLPGLGSDPYSTTVGEPGTSLKPSPEPGQEDGRTKDEPSVSVQQYQDHGNTLCHEGTRFKAVEYRQEAGRTKSIPEKRDRVPRNRKESYGTTLNHVQSQEWLGSGSKSRAIVWDRIQHTIRSRYILYYGLHQGEHGPPRSARNDLEGKGNQV